MDIKSFDPFKHISVDGMKKLIAEYGDEITRLREENKELEHRYALAISANTKLLDEELAAQDALKAAKSALDGLTSVNEELEHRLMLAKAFGEEEAGAHNEASAEVGRLMEENKRMRDALKPFADRAGKLDGYWLDHDTCWSPRYGGTAVTIADLRRAYATLATTGGE